MSVGLEIVKSKRVWFIPDFSVWGVSQDGEIDFLVTEGINTTQIILFGNQAIGSTFQEVEYSNLTDHRGNNLPSNIDTPRVIHRSKSEHPVFIVGKESDSGFRIARDPDATEPVLVDLMIVEMGS